MSRTMRGTLTVLAEVLARGLELAVVAAFAALVLVVLWGVGSRFVLNAPSRWTEEVAVFLLMWVALLGAAVAFRRQDHLGVDSIVGMLHPSARLLMALIGQVLIAAFALAVLVYGGSVLVRETLASGQVTPATGLPMGYVYLAAPISGAFVLLFVVERAVTLLSDPSGAVDGEAGGRGPTPPHPEIEEGIEAMDAQLLILIVFFALLTAINLPVAVAIALATLMTVLSLADLPGCYIVAQRMSIGIASFPLLAIPFFILAGLLMGEGGIARRLIDFALALIPGRRGGLAYVNTLTCMLFGAISGSATAAVSSIGGIMIPEMTRAGYDRRYSVALTTTSATTGLLIPPSNIMIVYAVAAGNVSVAAMFAAGLLPGILVGLAILAVCTVYRGTARQPGRSPGSAVGPRVDVRRVASTGVRAAPGLFLIVVVLAGILRGWFSATEASAIAVLYAFLLAVVFYRTVRLRDLPAILLRSGTTTGVVFLLIGTSQAMSWILTYENVPQSVGEALLDSSTSGIVILLLMNAILLLVGAVMDMTPAVLIFTPIFLPVAASLGVDPVHFGVMLVTNLCVGLCTPPVGTCLFVGCSVGKIGIGEAVRPMIPFLLAMVAALALITFWPAVTLWLPGVLGLG